MLGVCSHTLLLVLLQVILTGGSAGGTSVFLALDYVAELVPATARFVGVSLGPPAPLP